VERIVFLGDPKAGVPLGLFVLYWVVEQINPWSIVLLMSSVLLKIYVLFLGGRAASPGLGAGVVAPMRQWPPSRALVLMSLRPSRLWAYVDYAGLHPLQWTYGGHET